MQSAPKNALLTILKHCSPPFHTAAPRRNSSGVWVPRFQYLPHLAPTVHASHHKQTMSQMIKKRLEQYWGWGLRHLGPLPCLSRSWCVANGDTSTTSFWRKKLHCTIMKPSLIHQSVVALFICPSPNPFAQNKKSMNAETPPERDFFYLRGMNREECVAPIPGRPCLTGWLCNLSVATSHRTRYTCQLTMRWRTRPGSGQPFQA